MLIEARQNPTGTASFRKAGTVNTDNKHKTPCRFFLAAKSFEELLSQSMFVVHVECRVRLRFLRLYRQNPGGNVVRAMA